MGQIRKNIIYRTLKITGFCIFVILTLMVLLPTIFQDQITEKIRKEINKDLTSELNFQDSELTFFRHFPSLTLSLDSLELKGSAPFEKDNFINARELSLSIDVFELITTRRIDIDGIYLVDSNINVQVDKLGKPNYNVFIKKQQKVVKDTLEEGLNLNLDIVSIENAGITYYDKALNIKLKAGNLNYKGKGNYVESDVQLRSLIKVGNVDFEFENTPYLMNKKIEADLYTMYNSNSLSLVFEENTLQVNNLNISFKGIVELLKSGYNIDLEINSQKGKLQDLFTALPPSYTTWNESTLIEGDLDAFLKIKGSFIESENKKPDVFMDIRVNNGMISYQEAPVPIKDLYLKLKTTLPSLDINRARFEADTLSFILNNDYVYGQITTEGNLESMTMAGWFKADINVEDLARAIGIKDYQLGGRLATNLTIDGTYDPDSKQFPKTKGDLKWQNGKLLTPYYPNAINNIELQMNLLNNDGTNQGTLIEIPRGKFNFEDEEFVFNARLEDLEDLDYKVKAKGVLNISNIYKVFARDDLEVDGKIAADLSLEGKQSDATNGNYEKLNNSGTLYLQNIATRSQLLPKPFIIREGTFQFHQDEMTFSDFRGEIGNNKMLMNGYLKNVINYSLSEDEILRGEFKLESQEINANEFILSTKGTSDTLPKAEVTEVKIDTSEANDGLIQIPGDLDLVLELDVQQLIYDEINIKDLLGILAIKDGSLILKKGNLELVGAKAKMEGLYKNEGSEKAYFNYAIQLKEFDVQRAYKELEIFRVMAPAAADAEGNISVNYKLQGVLDSQMQPILESLEGGGTLSVKQVKLQGHHMMGAVSSKTSKEALKNPDLSEVEIKSTLRNNILNIEQFKFKVKPFKLKLEGQTSLSGDLNLKMRIGLPPFGIIGIPISVTGNSEDPVVKLGKKTKDLEETLAEDDSFSDLDKAKIAALKDSINDGMSMEEIEALQEKLNEMPEETFFKTNDTLDGRLIGQLRKDYSIPADTSNPINLTIKERDTLDR